MLRRRLPPPVSLLAMLAINAGMGCGGIGLSFLIFSMFPMFALLIALPINFFLFALRGERFSGWGYAGAAAIVYAAAFAALIGARLAGVHFT